MATGSRIGTTVSAIVLGLLGVACTPGAAPQGGSPSSPPATAPIGGSVTFGNARPAAIEATGGHVRVRPTDGVIRYEARLPFGAAEGPGAHILTVELDRFTPQATFAAARVQVLEFQASGMGGGLVAVLESRECSVQLDDGGGSGELSCLLRPIDKADVAPTAVAARWRADRVPDLAGAAVTVGWVVGDRYASSGSATVWSDMSREAVADLLMLPDVRLAGEPFEPELLRIVIRGYHGDGAYSGEDVDPSLQNVRADSPRLSAGSITLIGTKERTAVSTAPGSDGWMPIFGPCTATVSDGGRKGSVSCAADPQHRDLPGAGSTTLRASWEPARN